MGLFNKIKSKTKKNDIGLESLMERDTLLRLRFGSILDYRHIKNVSIMLGENEYCFFKDNAEITEEKEETIGYKSNYDGFSINVARGLSFRTGDGKSQPIKKTKEIEYKGILYLTNKRVIYVSEKIGFDKKIADITSIQGMYGILILQIGSKTYSFTTSYADEFLQVFNDVCSIDITKLPEPRETPVNAYDGEVIFESGKADPLYYLVGSGLIKNGGNPTLIHRRLLPIKYMRIYNIVQDLIKENVIADERTEDGRYKVIMTYEEWLNKRIANKEY